MHVNKRKLMFNFLENFGIIEDLFAAVGHPLFEGAVLLFSYTLLFYFHLLWNSTDSLSAKMFLKHYWWQYWCENSTRPHFLLFSRLSALFSRDAFYTFSPLCFPSPFLILHLPLWVSRGNNVHKHSRQTGEALVLFTEGKRKKREHKKGAERIHQCAFPCRHPF